MSDFFKLIKCLLGFHDWDCVTYRGGEYRECKFCRCFQFLDGPWYRGGSQWDTRKKQKVLDFLQITEEIFDEQKEVGDE